MRGTEEKASFGGLLRDFRLSAQLSQEALAERAAMSADGISALERGVNKAPQRETLALLVDALNLQPSQREALEAAAQRKSQPRRTRSRASSRSNLPRALSVIVGREDDLAEARDLIAKVPLVTLTGTGGVGKTRLALEIGYTLQDEFEDGVWFVDLAAVRDAGALPGAIANVFGIREQANRPLIDGVADILQRKKLLLILDNCEHVVRATAAAVESIASRCPNARILATSRQPLEVTGELTYRLASLSLEASVRLFTDNAVRADASFSANGDGVIVERICERLDGIALAIELAAARVRVLSLAEIEALLSQRFAVLAGGGPLTRHQTMRALIDWSYDLLEPEERLLFARLGVFPAEFSFEASVAICGGEGIAAAHVLDRLTSLLDKSLLTSERHGKARRFRMLETMRAYALEKLGSAIDQIAQRHAQYYLTFVVSRDWRTPDWQDSLELESDNLRRALDWAIDEDGDAQLGVSLLAAALEFLLYRGLGAYAARLAERALNGASLPKLLQARAWETISAMRGDMLMPAAALEASDRVLTLYDELGDLGGVARALRRRGVANLRLGNFAQADADLQRALELSKKYDDSRGVARTLGSIAVSFEMRGRPHEGRDAMLEVLELARQEGDERIIGVTLINLAEAEFALGEIEMAASRLEEMLTSNASRKNARLRAHAKANLAVYLLGLHRQDEARALAREAILEAREAGDSGIAACAIQHLASMLSSADSRTAAKLLGYVDSVFASGYRRENTERYTYNLLMSLLRETLREDEIAALGRDGAGMSELQAVRLATRAHKTTTVSP